MLTKTTRGTARARRAARAPLRGGRRTRRNDRADPDSHNERVRLITFVWTGRTGSQPVIFADRSWLQ
jgi:hypothetical protein